MPMPPASDLPDLPDLPALPTLVIKRDGTRQPFDPVRIERALALCFLDIGQVPHTRIQTLTERVLGRLRAEGVDAVLVEHLQDLAEDELIAANEAAAAKHYISYRLRHEQQRVARPVPSGVKAAFEQAEPYFPTPLQQFQFFDKYSRYQQELGRRETWPETVTRATDYLRELVQTHYNGDPFEPAVWTAVHDAILTMEVMPSMRLLAQAGPAARRQNLALYNCSALPVTDLWAFSEMLLISMAGCGVGFSVERQFVEQLPRIQRQKWPTADLYVVEDTTEGWAAALACGLDHWFAGSDVNFDLSQVRPAGSVLRTKGGRASGPEPLRQMLAAIRRIVLSRQGSFLRPIDAHDIACHVGSAAVMGGTRRTAMISLFDWDDYEMLHAKDGDLSQNTQRYNANNSVVWPAGGVTQLDVMRQFLAMADGGRGEPGIFNREAARLLRPERRADATFLTNPCGEVILRPYGLCNLSVAVARADDTYENLHRKVDLATFIGTVQSLATHFPGLRDEWRRNAEEERLLGVDITGQQDCRLLTRRDEAMVASVFQGLRRVAVLANDKYASALGINPSAAITCVKPSGNSSQLLDCSSGLHPRWAKFYLRRVRVMASSPIYQVLRDAGVPLDPEVGQDAATAQTFVATFPVAAPSGAITRADVSAIEQCQFWLANKRFYTEHNPSVTITYQPDEIIGLAQWVHTHQDVIGGMAFLPASDAQYQLMPYEEISETEYRLRAASFPEIDWSKLYRYEQTDQSDAAQELSCFAGQCEL